eukprot:16432918-Heterocapsa_arctica.AAC.1
MRDSQHSPPILPGHEVRAGQKLLRFVEAAADVGEREQLSLVGDRRAGVGGIRPGPLAAKLNKGFRG